MQDFNITIFTGSYKIDKLNSKTMQFEDQKQAAIFCAHLTVFLGEPIRMAYRVYEGNGNYFYPEEYMD